MTRFWTDKNIWRLIALIAFGINTTASVIILLTVKVQVPIYSYKVPIGAIVFASGTALILLVAVIPNLKVIEAIRAWRGK